MLLHIENCIKVFFLFFLTNVCSRNVPSKDFLSRLLANRDRGPVVVFLDPEQAKSVGFKLPEPEKKIKPGDVDNFDVAFDDSPPLQEYSGDPGENDAYVLYSIIKATQKQEQMDHKANYEFEKTKDILRTMFESRCVTRQICENRCEQKPEPKQACETQCQQIYDKMDACGDTTTTTKADECTTTSTCRTTKSTCAWLRNLYKKR